jgi:hypothetical protein
MRHFPRASTRLQSRIDTRRISPDTLLPSWPAFCATACRIELLHPPVQASDCKTCSEAGLLTCSSLPYKQAAFWTRRPQRPGLHTCTPRGACSTALRQRTSAGWVLLATLHSLCAKLCCAVSSVRCCISTFFAIVQRSPDCILTGGAFDCRRRERQASSLCPVQPHVQRGGIFRSRTATPLLGCRTGVISGSVFVRRTRNLTTLMGNANTYVLLARCSPDVLGIRYSVRFSARCRQYSRYYKPGWPPQDIG